MSIREEIAQAVGGSAYWSARTAPGALFVRLERIEYPNAFGAVAHYNVVLVLPQDLAAAERMLEDRLPEIKADLDPHLVVTSVTPTRLDTGSGVLPCAFINGHREAD